MAGVDPGTTAAVAVLTLGGEVISLYSGKNFSLQDIISFISEYGSPCIIATDVNPAPQTVDKLCHSFDCKLHIPPSDLSVDEKNELTRNYDFKNFHQRDALAAALKALEHHKAKFDNIDARLHEKNMEEHSEMIKSLVLRGYPVERAISMVEEKISQPESPPQELPLTAEPEPAQKHSAELLQKKVADLTHTVERLTEYRTELEQENQNLRQQLEDAQQNLRLYDRKSRKEVLESQAIKSKESHIKKLGEELKIEREKARLLSQENEILKEMRTLEYSQKALPVKVLPRFSKEEIRALDDRFTIKEGDIIYLQDPSGGGATTARELMEKGVRAIISKERMSHLAEEEFTRAKIPVISEREIPLKVLGNFGVISREDFESEFNQWKMAQEIVEAKQKEKQLKTIIEEYKEKRIKDGIEQVSE
ncbi:MAG: DUF460 domain-containing protein [Theionarchaea archaeon]|nr:DUF460 domain-containing protein [Theionarchaea archaeon]MBU6999842.1 DUF460 domain-containing protein [Theionarchaea archaeon]MBU7021953.1 DUF460 domain-containing protein [Theionarchaea archaeon]MBU7035228.1 DUF460 domain-containing protein [Theionarchaea archaeon]MBU7040698.1 DUF460 domain-containing protein [Theionarchaea archaeon]